MSPICSRRYLDPSTSTNTQTSPAARDTTEPRGEGKRLKVWRERNTVRRGNPSLFCKRRRHRPNIPTLQVQRWAVATDKLLTPSILDSQADKHPTATYGNLSWISEIAQREKKKDNGNQETGNGIRTGTPPTTRLQETSTALQHLIPLQTRPS